VVAGYKGGSPDIPSSIERVDGYTKELQEKWGVKIYESIEELCKNVDGVLIENVDGRPHLEAAKLVIAAGLPFLYRQTHWGNLSGLCGKSPGWPKKRASLGSAALACAGERPEWKRLHPRKSEKYSAATPHPL
jgi:hypothetical protein